MLEESYKFTDGTTLIKISIVDLPEKEVEWINKTLFVGDLSIFELRGVYPDGKKRSGWHLSDFDEKLKLKPRNGLLDPEGGYFYLDVAVVGGMVLNFTVAIPVNRSYEKFIRNFESEVDRLIEIREELRRIEKELLSRPYFRNKMLSSKFGI